MATLGRLLRPASVATAARGVRQLNTKALPGSAQVTIQRVKMSKRKPGFMFYLTYGLVGYACYEFTIHLIINPLLNALHKAAESLPPEPGGEDEEDDIEGIFLPFPLTTKMVDPGPYSGDDPEWREFQRMSKDKVLQTKIRDDLAHLIRREVERTPFISKRMGSRWTVRRAWLDIDYPFSPPPEYERSGLLLDDEGIKWAAQPIDSAVVFRSNRIIWPSALFYSSIAFSEALIKQHVSDVAKYFGFQAQGPSPASQAPKGQPLPPSANSEIQKALQQVRQRSTRRPEEVKDPSTLASKKTAEPPAPARTEKPPPANTEAVKSIGSASDNAKPDEEFQEKFFGHSRIRSLIGTRPVEAFNKKFAQLWRPIIPYPPRGCVIVSGMVELEAPRGWVVMDVVAFYDPAEKKYDMNSLSIRLRRVQAKQQYPRGPKRE